MAAPVHHVPTTHRTDRRLATLVVGLLTLAPVGLGVASVASSSGGPQGPEIVYGQEVESPWRILDATTVAPLQPDGAPQSASGHELPLGPSRIRVEVVAAGGNTMTSLHLRAREGNAMHVDLPLPAAFELRGQGGPDGVELTLAPNDESVEIQCRIYADDRLVAISTGRGLVECAARPSG